MKLLAPVLGLLMALAAVEIVARQLPIDQAPRLVWDAQNQLLMHAPNQTGVRYLDGHPVRYTINAQGWNAVGDYPPQDHTKHLAVVIGDSFVEALQVAPFENVSARLHQALGSSWRVYGMGMSGAPLSQYVQMARYAARTYHPDIIVVVLVHNDFIESYESPANALYDAFWHSSGSRMVMPQVYAERFGTRLLASWWTGRLALRTLRRSLTVQAGSNWSMGIDVERNTRQADQNAYVTDYLFGQLEQLKTQSSVLLVMDGPRDTIERGDDPTQSPVFALNIMARTLAAAHGLRFFDLTRAFVESEKSDLEHFDTPQLRITTTRSFSFQSDYHWNAYTHDLVARTIAPLVLHQ